MCSVVAGFGIRDATRFGNEMRGRRWKVLRRPKACQDAHTILSMLMRPFKHASGRRPPYGERVLLRSGEVSRCQKKLLLHNPTEMYARSLYRAHEGSDRCSL